MDLRYILNCLETNNLDFVDLDVALMCRTCTSQDSIEFRNVFESTGVLKRADGKVFHINEIIQRLSGIAVLPGDGLPERICRSCVKQFYTAFNFISQAQSVDRALQSFLRITQPQDTSSPAPSSPGKKPTPRVKPVVKQPPPRAKESTPPPSPTKAANIVPEPDDEDDQPIVVHDELEEESEITFELEIKNDYDEEGQEGLTVSAEVDSADGDVKIGPVVYQVNSVSASPKKRKAKTSTDKADEDYKPKKPKGDVKPKRGSHNEFIETTPDGLKCLLCPKLFKFKQSMIRHVKAAHGTGENQKSCSYCDKKFHRADDLKRHTRTHTGERPYACTECTKSFKQSSELNEHLRSHRKDTIYTCTDCTKNFTTRMGLYQHRKKIHGDVRSS